MYIGIVRNCIGIYGICKGCALELPGFAHECIGCALELIGFARIGIGIYRISIEFALGFQGFAIKFKCVAKELHWDWEDVHRICI